MTYAENTTVSADKSRADIESVLRRYGADQFIYGWDERGAMVAFRMNERHVRFVLPMPDRYDEEFTLTPSKRKRRSVAEADKAWEQATRSRWRSLHLVIKAKLEAVATGITTFESEFLAQIMLPDGSTVGEWAGPQVEKAYHDGKMPPMLAIGSVSQG